MDNVDELIKKFDVFAEETKKELANIKRGVYGDQVNGVKGLIERQNEDEERMDKMERVLYKTAVWLGVIVIGLDAIWNIVKSHLVK